MSRFHMPRLYSAILTPDPESEPVAVAVMAMDTTDDAYLVVGPQGDSWWEPIHAVRFADDIITAAINRADEALRTTRAVAA